MFRVDVNSGLGNLMGGAPGMMSRLPIRGGVEDVIKSVVTGSFRCPSLRTEKCEIRPVNLNEKRTAFGDFLVNRRVLW